MALMFSQFVGKQLEISFDDGPHRCVAHIHVFDQLLNGPLWVPPHPLLNSLNHLPSMD